MADLGEAYAACREWATAGVAAQCRATGAFTDEECRNAR
jgi:hypothetical protein